MMPGVTLREIHEAILNAYEDDELRFTVRALMDVKLNNEDAPGPFSKRVFDFIEWAERRGREVELIQVTAKARPRNLQMQGIYKKYGMAVPVYVEQAGVDVPSAPTDTVDGGLEKIVKPHLSFADFGIWRERMTAVEGRVCLITINGAAQGTGFLVGPDVVLTNYHVMMPVLGGSKKSTDFECVFDYKLHPDNTTSRTPVALHPTDWNVDSSPFTPAEAEGKPDQTEPTADELDYALIRLADAIGTKPWAQHPNSEGGAPGRGWVRVPDADPVFKSPMGVVIAQHPVGHPLKLALDTEAIPKNGKLGVNKNGTRVRYATNTLGGSSGSPVFDLEWNLLALHHYGDPNYNHPARYNQGVPIGMIRKRLTANGTAGTLGGDAQ